MQGKIHLFIAIACLLLIMTCGRVAVAQGNCYNTQGCSDYANFGYNSSGAATLEYDNYVSTFHTTAVRDIDGTLKIWGEGSRPDGVGFFAVPTPINAGNYPGLTGTPLKIAMGSNDRLGTAVSRGIQMIVLTSDDKLWVWGPDNIVLDGSLTTSYSAFEELSLGLPPGVTANQVRMMFATYRTLVITTCGGDVWVLSMVSEMRGDGGTGSSTAWSRVQKSTGGYLTNVVAVRGAHHIHNFVTYSPSYGALMALDASGNLWTWGPTALLGSGGAMANVAISKATQMALPAGSSSSAIKMIGVTPTPWNSYPTYYALYENGSLYAMGSNAYNQIGDWTTTDRSTWVQPRYTSATGPVMNDIKWISPQEHDNGDPFINVITSDKKLFNWGVESGNDLGRSAESSMSASSSVNPGEPANFEAGYSNSGIIAVESGGHTTMVLKECVNNFGYVGHRINGSMGDNTTDNGPTGDGVTDEVFHFRTNAVQVCGAPTVDVTLIPSANGPYCKDNATVSMIGNPSGGTYGIDPSTPGVASIDPVTGALTFIGTGTLRVTYTAASDNCGAYTTVSTLLNVSDCNNATLSIPGQVWIDEDQDAIIDAAETGTDNGFWANLTGPNGTVIASVKVNPDGAFNFVVSKTLLASVGSYYIILTNTANYAGDALATPGSTPLNSYNYTGTNRGNTSGCTTACRSGYINLGDISTAPANSTLPTANFGITNKPLPVTLISFNAKAEGKMAVLNWATISELNNKGFEPQRSPDGRNWKTLGFVAGKAMNGTGKTEYSFPDNTLPAGTNYYRLKQIDLNGAFEYSQMVSLRANGEAVSAEPYPNPVSDRVFLQNIAPEMVKGLNVLSIDGRSLYETTRVTAEGIDVSGLPDGLYVMKIKQADGTTSSHKIVITR